LAYHPLLDSLIRDHQTLRLEHLEGTDLELVEEWLRTLSRHPKAYSSLTRKFREDVRTPTEYSDLFPTMRVAIVLLKVTHDISFMLNSEGGGDLNLSARIKGQTVFFAVS
jgi:hypothetical protein